MTNLMSEIEMYIFDLYLFENEQNCKKIMKEKSRFFNKIMKFMVDL